MPELDPSQIIEALAHLRLTRPRVFGADAHGFLLNPKLAETDVVAFERTYHVVLPRDFKRFLTAVGDGGAGPFYGVFPLGKVDDNFDLKDWDEADLSILSEPFPFDEEWNDLSAMPEGDPGDRDEPEYCKQMEVFEDTYFATALVNGSFPICHQGCARRVLMVVTGNQAGYLWEDGRSELAGLKPIRRADGSLATFSGWYYDWLNSCLDSARQLER